MYRQQQITPAVAYEVTIKIGIIPGELHGQWQYEVRSATDGVLLEMGSKHHFHLGDWAEAKADLGQLISDRLYHLSHEPFE